MIRSFSHASAFQKQIIEINKPSPKSGYLWRRRSDMTHYLYCDGAIIGQAKTAALLLPLLKAHATRMGEWFKPNLVAHYLSNKDGIWRLYINERYCKKSRDRKDLEEYVEVVSWIEQSGRAKSWGRN